MRRIIELCGAAKFKSSIDLTSGFLQVNLENESKKYCAFRTDLGFFEYCKMPFGAKNSSKTFQRLMNFVLRGAESYCLSHIDDIIIFSETWESHLAHLRDILLRLKDAGLVAKKSKAKFGRDKLKCLGHVLENQKIYPDPDKIKAISEWPPLKTKKNVKSFVDCANFYRSFIHNFASIAKPLTDLTRRDQPEKLIWKDIHEQAFQALKNSLCAGPVLAPPDPTRPYIFKSDASANAVACILLQCNEVGEEHPVGFASRKLLPRESHYSTVERELLGIVWGLSHFESYTYGSTIEVRTDHACLKWLSHMANQNARLTRWAIALERYNISEINHVPGKNFNDVDGLSRSFL